MSALKTCRTISGCHEGNSKQGRATVESNFFYLRSSYLLMTMDHALFEEDKVFESTLMITISNR